MFPGERASSSRRAQRGVSKDDRWISYHHDSPADDSLADEQVGDAGPRGKTQTPDQSSVDEMACPRASGR
jgi:hypothetical protein